MNKVIISGVSSGLGKAMAKCFQSAGWKIIGISRKRPDFEIDRWIQADITQKSDREKLDEILKNEYSDGIQILINNAGRGLYETWGLSDEKSIREIFELNFFAHIELSRKIIPLLEKSRGTMINISSAASFIPVPCMGVYCASKAALSMFSETLRIELSQKKINVMDVAPGRIETGFSERSIGSKKVPETPGTVANSAKFAKAVYKSWKKGRKKLVYPSYYRFLLFLIKLFPGFYTRENLKRWKI